MVLRLIYIQKFSPMPGLPECARVTASSDYASSTAAIVEVIAEMLSKITATVKRKSLQLAMKKKDF